MLLVIKDSWNISSQNEDLLHYSLLFQVNSNINSHRLLKKFKESKYEHDVKE